MANKYIGALWLKKSKNGLVYMSGQVEIDGTKHQITVFKNERKEEGSNQPDYQILKSEYKKQPIKKEGPAEESFVPEDINEANEAAQIASDKQK